MNSTTTERVDVPAAPAIPGLVFRRFRGPSDYPGMIESNMAARDAYGVEGTVTVEGMANNYAHLTNSDVERDLVIVELDGRIVGYTRVQWDDQQDGSRAYHAICLLRPELRGRGIGRAMLAWDEIRIREIAATHADDGRPRWFQASSWDADDRAVALLRRAGYAPVRRSHEMVRPHLDDIPDAPMPDGVELHPVTRDDMRAVWEADVEIFRDHWGERDDSEESWPRFRDRPDFDPSLWVVAWDGDRVAGMVVNVIDPADTARTGSVRGLLDTVGIRREWRRRGLARALIVRSLALLRDRGATSAFLGVDAENPNRALTLYERCGFRTTTSETVWRRSLTVNEVAP